MRSWFCVEIERQDEFYNPPMSVFALGLNHSTAPVDLRGRFAFTLEQLAPSLVGLSRAIAAHIGNARGGHPFDLQSHRAVLRGRPRPSRANSSFRPSTGWRASAASAASICCDHAYVMEGGQVARHAFRVASGLDSMVLGEPQILGQMKQAVREAERGRHARQHFASVVSALVFCGQGSAHRHRDRCAFDQHGVGFGASCCQLFEDLRDIRVLFVGAGEMIELRGHALSRRAHRVRWRLPTARWSAARNLPAVSAPKRSDWRTCRRGSAEFDAVISCTASSLPIIGLGRGGARAEGAQASTDIHDRSGGAARHRAGSGAPGRRISLHDR